MFSFSTSRRSNSPPTPPTSPNCFHLGLLPKSNAKFAFQCTCLPLYHTCSLALVTPSPPHLIVFASKCVSCQAKIAIVIYSISVFRSVYPIIAPCPPLVVAVSSTPYSYSYLLLLCSCLPSRAVRLQDFFVVVVLPPSIPHSPKLRTLLLACLLRCVYLFLFAPLSVSLALRLALLLRFKSYQYN